MKRKFITFLLLLPVCFLLLWGWRHIHARQRSVPQLTISEAILPLALYIDNQIMGTLPLRNLTLEPGLHRLVLRTVIGEEKQLLWWQKEINIQPQEEVEMSLQGNDTNGLAGVVLLKKYPARSLDYSRIFVDPNVVGVQVNDRWYTDVPVLLENVSAGTYHITTRSPVYPDVSFNVSVPAGMAFEAHIQLYYDYFSAIQPLSNIEIEPQEATDHDYKRRWHWEEEFLPVPADQLHFAKWEKLQTFQLPVPDGLSTLEMLQQLERVFIEQEELFRLPFCFVVDQTGHVWEGLGLWDYNYSQLTVEKLSFDAGACPVLVIGTSVTTEQQQALHELLAFVTKPPLSIAHTHLDQSEVEVNLEEWFTIEGTLQNVGWDNWRNTQENKVSFRPVQTGRLAETYYADGWISPEVITYLNDPLVIPGAQTRVTLSLRAPYYPHEFIEQVVVYQDEQEIAGPGLRFTVTAKGTGVGIEIMSGPHGFLNVFEAASSGSPLMASVYPGERYLGLELHNGWRKIRLVDGREGWVENRYVKEL